jgi:excisionase family DNA binding protein
MSNNALRTEPPLSSVQAAPSNRSDIISAAEACEILGIHRNTLYKLLETAEIPAFRLTTGGRWRFRRTELESWLQDQEARRRL